jgi:hypothetical protein
MANRPDYYRFFDIAFYTSGLLLITALQELTSWITVHCYLI